jgi:hypothetical protein
MEVIGIAYLKYSLAGDRMRSQGISEVMLSQVLLQNSVFQVLLQEFHGNSQDKLLPK